MEKATVGQGCCIDFFLVDPAIFTYVGEKSKYLYRIDPTGVDVVWCITNKEYFSVSGEHIFAVCTTTLHLLMCQVHVRQIKRLKSIQDYIKNILSTRLKFPSIFVS